jgi:hypothetical protein
MILSGELEKVVVAGFNLLSQHLPGETEVNHETPVRIDARSKTQT